MKNKDLEDLKEFLESQKRSNRGDCPDCDSRYHRCPYCDPNYRRPDPWRESQCTLNKPLMMVIPPEGVHLSCPVHPEGHHVFGPAVHWMDRPTHDWDFEKSAKPWCEYDSTYRPIDYDNTQRSIDYDSTRPFGTCTGDSIGDSHKLF